MKRLPIYITAIFICLIGSMTLMVFALLLNQEDLEKTYEIGNIEVDALIYYEVDGITYEAPNVTISISQNTFKTGIYDINVTNANDVSFIENLRIKFLIKSNVLTFLRIEVIESLTLTIENFEGVTTEIPIISLPTPFFYDANWYDNRLNDRYFYYQNPILRTDEETPFELSFISSYFPGVNYNVRPLGYSLQMGLRIEAVQAIKGPMMQWGLEIPPWGGQWL